MNLLARALGRVGSVFRPAASAGETTTLQNPAVWLTDWAGRRTASGESVTGETALGLPAYMAALRIVSGDVAKVVKRLHKRRVTRGSDIDEGHPVDDLLHDRWNPIMSSFDGWRVLVHRAMGWGIGPAEIVRDGDGRPIELWPIHPSRITPELQSDGRTLKYIWRQKGFKTVTLDSRDVFCLKGMGDGIRGYSVVRYAAETLGLGLAAQRHAAAFFGEGMGKRLVATTAETLKPAHQKQVRKIISGGNSEHAGTPGRRKIPFIPGDVKLTDAGISPKDAQFIESIEFFGVADVSRITGCPLWLLSSDKQAKGWSSYAMSYQAYIDSTLVHHGEAIRGEARLKLISDDERRTHKVVMNYNSLMRADAAARDKYLTSRQRNGTLTRNEARALDDLNPIEDDPNADRYYITADLKPADQEDAEPEERPPTPQPAPREDEEDEPGEGDDPDDQEAEDVAKRLRVAAESVRPVFMDAAGRLVRNELSQLRSARKRHAGNKPAFLTWAKKFDARYFDDFPEAFVVACESLVGVVRAMGVASLDPSLRVSAAGIDRAHAAVDEDEAARTVLICTHALDQALAQITKELPDA